MSEISWWIKECDRLNKNLHQKEMDIIIVREALKFYAKLNDTKGCFKRLKHTTDLSKTTAVLHMEITEKNRYFESERTSLTGRGQIDGGKKAREALEKTKQPRIVE